MRSAFQRIYGVALATAIGGLLVLTGCGDGSNAHASTAAAPSELKGVSFRRAAPAPAEPANPSVVEGTIADDPAEMETASPAVADRETRRPAPQTVQDVLDTMPDIAPVKRAPVDENAPVGRPDAKRPEFLSVSFNELITFDYDPFEAAVPMETTAAGDSAPASDPAPTAGSDRGPNWQIPKRIMALDKKKVVLDGFMVPIEIRKDDVRSFLLVRNQMVCCFGVMVSFNEWAFVQMAGDKRAKFVPDTVVSVYGTLEVGEDVQNGMVMSIYRMNADECVQKSGF